MPSVAVFQSCVCCIDPAPWQKSCLFTHAPSTTWIPDFLHTFPKLNAYTYQLSYLCFHDMQVVGEHYSTFTSEDLSLSIGFESNKISLDVPEDGAQLKDDWKIYPRYDPAVSSHTYYFTDFFWRTFLQIIG